MSTEAFDIDTFLSDSPVDAGSSFGSELTRTDGTQGTAWAEPGYEGKIDYRIRQLSYSSLTTLHSCPRKFQLYRLKTTHRTEESLKSTITFSFGHVVGEGIQMIFAGASETSIIWRMFNMWHAPLPAIDEKSHKSFYFAVFAIQKLLSLREQGFLNEYELVYVDAKPACELSFCVNFPGGFRLRGFVDAVLKHKETGEILVLEAKTTNESTIHPAKYKNSAQAIGYSIVLDHLFADLSSYKVLYLVYQTKSKEYTAIPFHKTFLQRALWIRELLLDIQTIEMYEEAEVYPMRGESCYSFGRECEYFQTCTLSTQYLTNKCTAEEEDKTQYQVVVSLEELLESQFSKMEN